MRGTGLLRKLTRNLTYIRTIRMHGRDVRVPVIEGQGDENRDSYEPLVDAILEATMAMGPGAFVDVGANVGQTLIKVKSLEPGRHYVGFEASPFCCYYVSRVIAENGYEDCILVPRALSNAPRVASFQFSGVADPQATVIEGFWTAANKRTNATTVLLDSGDAVMELLGRPKVGVLKVDVEGGELEVFGGFPQTVARDRPFIISEVLPHVPEETFADEASRAAMRQRRERSQALGALLKSYNYDCYRLGKDGALVATWEYGMPVFDDSYSNYVFVPAGRDKVVAELQSRYGAAIKGV